LNAGLCFGEAVSQSEMREEEVQFLLGDGVLMHQLVHQLRGKLWFRFVHAFHVDALEGTGTGFGGFRGGCWEWRGGWGVDCVIRRMVIG
jgi:hypothetical protein